MKTEIEEYTCWCGRAYASLMGSIDADLQRDIRRSQLRRAPVRASIGSKQPLMRPGMQVNRVFVEVGEQRDLHIVSNAL